MKTQNISVAKLFNNEGQIPGLKKNPRFIKDDKFALLVKSLQDDPEMLELRELIVYPLQPDHFVVIAGNMRLRAAEEIGLTFMPCKVLPNDFPIKKMEAVLIKDNSNFGQNDFDLLFSEWDTEELRSWGVDVHFPRDTAATDPPTGVQTTQIVLEYTLQDFERVRDYLAKISDNPEQAVWKLCGFE